jgi:hypothetical protein
MNMANINSFEAFNLGDVVRITSKTGKDVISSGTKLITGKVIAKNSADKSIALVNQATGEKIATLIIPTVIGVYNFELVSSNLTDNQTLDMQAKATAWIIRFNSFKDNLKKVAFPLTSDGRTAMNTAVKDVNSLINDYNYLNFAMNDNDRNSLQSALNDSLKQLMDITNKNYYDLQRKAALMAVLDNITSLLRVPGNFLISLPAEVGKRLIDLLPENPWIRYSIVGGVVLFVGGIIYLKIK